MKKLTTKQAWKFLRERFEDCDEQGRAVIGGVPCSYLSIAIAGMCHHKIIDRETVEEMWLPISKALKEKGLKVTGALWPSGNAKERAAFCLKQELACEKKKKPKSP